MSTHRQTTHGDRIMADLLAPFTPDACERETVRGMNRVAPRCSQGHATVYSHAVGAFRCEFGALVKGNGREVCGCE